MCKTHVGMSVNMTLPPVLQLIHVCYQERVQWDEGIPALLLLQLGAQRRQPDGNV